MSDWQRAAAALFRRLPPETAHWAALAGLRLGLVPRARRPDPPALGVRLWGLDFPNPVGMAAGFDKNGEAVAPLLGLGFGSVEVGTVTPRPQPGNPRPRLFRLAGDEAVVNRLGFNSEGMDAVAARLAHRSAGGILGINIGCNRESADPVADYRAALEKLGPLADYVTVNISSPNTPGLRDLQDRARLEALIGVLDQARAGLRSARGARLPLLLKIAPELSESQRRGIAELARAGPVDGLIVSNTTTARPLGLRGRAREEPGGLSGRPLFEPSTRLLAELYRETGGTVPLVGVGGIFSGADAYAKIRAGASLVQLYSGLIDQGPGLVNSLKAELASLLQRDGFTSLVQAVGADYTKGH